MKEHAPNPQGNHPAGGQENVFSPNLARYLKPEAASRASNNENNHAHQPQLANRGGKKKRKTALSRKNLVVMYPAKHLHSLENNANDSVNLTQLLFSPTNEKEEVLHSIFSPVGRRQHKGQQRQVSKKATTAHRGIANNVDENSATNHHGDNHTTLHSRTGDDGHFVNNNIVLQVEAEKENIPPTQHADDLPHSDCRFPPFANTETQDKELIDDGSSSSSSSLQEFYTPKSRPKTPCTKASSKLTFHKIEESVSYDTFNTNTFSRAHMLGSFAKDECFGQVEKKEEGMHTGKPLERKDDEIVYEEEESIMVFVTPKQRESSSMRNQSNDNGDDDDDDDEEFFSPLAQYPPPSNDCRSSSDENAAFDPLSMTTNEKNNVSSQDPLLENGSSYYLINEVKNILATTKRDSSKDSSLPVIHDDASIDYVVTDENEFFSPLVQHPPSSSECGSFWTLPHESSFHDLSPIPTHNNNATTLDECALFEDGSSYHLINDVKSILAASKSDEPRIPPLPVAHPGGPSFGSGDNSTPATDAIREEEKLSHPEIQPKSISINNKTPNSQHTQLTPHLHPISVSPLPAGALTVDFVKKCESAEILETILSVLSSTKRGKQLRQPSLVQLVKKRLEKVNSQKNSVGGVKAIGSPEGIESNVDNANGHQEPQWNHFPRGTEWKVTLPPRIAVGRKGVKNLMWSEEARDDADVSVNSNSFQVSSFGSSIQDAKDNTEVNGTNNNDPVVMTPNTVNVVSLPTFPSSSPSIQLSSIAESSLDMNLSESFNLGDESAYWKHIAENANVGKELSIQEEIPGAAAPNTQSNLEVELKNQLEKIQTAYQQAKSDVKRLTALLEESEKQKEASVPDTPNFEELRKETEAARLANRALANALAISEKDLAEAIELRDKKALECKQLLSKVNETADQNAFLSSKIKKLEKELQSCNAYIDSLYAELHDKSPLNNLQAELEQRETEWLALENRYNETIEQLQAELNAQSKKVSMDMYLSMMKAARQHKLDAAEKQHKIDELSTMVGSLRDQIQKMQTASSKSSLKSISALHSKIRLRQVSPTNQQNDENKQPNQQPQQQDQFVGNHNSINIGAAKSGYIISGKTTRESGKGLSNHLLRAGRFESSTLKV